MDQTLPAGPPAAVSAVGLSSAEAQDRLQRYGPNRIPEQRQQHLQALLGKFWAPVPWLLEATILLQMLLGKGREAAIVAALLAFNAAVGFINEGRANKALTLLRRRLGRQARVLRDGRWQSLPAAQLVPGDTVHVRAGDLSPADVRITAGQILLDASALTGESEPLEISPGALAYAATTIRSGEATGEVIATGPRTYFGRTAELVRTAHPASHLQTTILSIVKGLAAADALMVCALLAYAFWAALPLAEMLPFGLILLVASVPVALPATFTLATALGATELAAGGVLVTRLEAIEEASGMDVLCTDKTGTITSNRLTVANAEPVAPCSRQALLRLAALASDAATQDQVDLAILKAAAAAGVSARNPSRIESLPFEPARRYALYRYAEPAGPLCVAKGAPSAIGALASDPPDLTAALGRMAQDGQRVLAVAAGTSRADLRPVGLIALNDPPRADAASLVAGLRDLGVRVLMLTGDNLSTARAVARQVGIGERTVASSEIPALPAARALDYDVYARVFPEDKIRLVRLLQQAGHVVGMTGDGVNDAPALKQADVGIAVAGATDVARAAAGVVLTSPGLLDALSAVRISRRIYQRMLTYSLNKVMKTLQIAVFLTAGVMALHAFVITPRLIVLLLFANDFVTMSIATDRVSCSPTPDRWNVRRLILTGALLAAMFLPLSFGVLYAGDALLKLPLAQLQTLVFLMLVATGQANVYLVRERRRIWNSRPSNWLLASSIGDLIAVSLLADRGILMAAISPLLIAALLIVVAAYLLLLDSLKVRIFDRLGIR